FDTFSMLLIDYDFDSKSQIFDLDAVAYADALRGQKWEHRFHADVVGDSVMVVCMDIYGNEARVLFDGATFRASREQRESRSRISTPIKRRVAVRQRGRGQKSARK